MRTSAQWWHEVKADPEKLVNWLKRQYHGELTAAERIEKYCLERAPEQWKRILAGIAHDERTHAEWVGRLLLARDITPTTLEKEERYWDKTLSGIDSFEKAAAVAAHAENMRLERIRILATEDDPKFKDIATTFSSILRDEGIHAIAFKRMAGSEALAQTIAAHVAGSEAIGLINTSEVL